MSALELNDAALLYADDLAVGDHLELGPYVVEEQEILDFGTSWDPLPIHTDPVAAAASPFGTLIASGVHTLAIYSRLVSPQFRARLALVAGKGIDRMRLPNPVRPGAVLTLTLRVVDVGDTGQGQHHADVRTHAVMTDQDGKVVLDLTSVLVVRVKPEESVEARK